jgi:hypothetical protein
LCGPWRLPPKVDDERDIRHNESPNIWIAATTEDVLAELSNGSAFDCDVVDALRHRLSRRPWRAMVSITSRA